MSENYRDILVGLNTSSWIMNEHKFSTQLKFGEPSSTDSEDFFADIAKFLANYKRVHAELFPPPKVST